VTHTPGGYPLADEQGADDAENEHKIFKNPEDKTDRVDQEASDDEEDRNEKRFTQKFELGTRRRVACRRVDRESSEEGTNDARQLNRIRKHAGDGHDPEHDNEVGVFLILDPLEHVSADAAQPEQNQHDIAGDFCQKDCNTRRRKAGRVDRETNGEHNKGQGIGHHRGADRYCYRLEATQAKVVDHGQPEQRMRCKQRSNHDCGNRRVAKCKPDGRTEQ
jgi:hypothetical protein